MTTIAVIQLIVIILLILASAFFSSAETAYTCVNKIQLQLLAEQGDHKKAKRALWICEHPQKMLSAILIGNNIVNIAASALATTFTITVFGSVYVALATGILTFIILMFGEITPKSIAVIRSLKLALNYSAAVYVTILVLTPVIFVVDKCKYGIMHLLGIKETDMHEPITEEELKTLVDVSYEEGAIENDEFEMITNIFSLDDLDARDIMIPRVDMVFVRADMTLSELMDVFKQHEYTRYPVYDETTDTVIGTINMKDLLLHENKKIDFSVRSILREPHFTFEHKEVGKLLIEMREKSINIIIVLDEYGATSGMITLEDILEEIVGEIRDEFDKDETDAIKECRKGREYLIKGSTGLIDVNEALGTRLESSDYDTIGGYFIEKLDRLPKKGESIELPEGLKMIAEYVTSNRINKIRVFINNSDKSPE